MSETETTSIVTGSESSTDSSVQRTDRLVFQRGMFRGKPYGTIEIRNGSEVVRDTIRFQFIPEKISQILGLKILQKRNPSDNSRIDRRDWFDIRIIKREEEWFVQRRSDGVDIARARKKVNVLRYIALCRNKLARYNSRYLKAQIKGYIGLARELAESSDCVERDKAYTLTVRAREVARWVGYKLYMATKEETEEIRDLIEGADGWSEDAVNTPMDEELAQINADAEEAALAPREDSESVQPETPSEVAAVA